MALLQVLRSDEIGKAIINPEDGKDLDLIEGDLISLINEEAGNTIYSRLFISEKIPRDMIALGDNLLDNLGVVNKDFVELSIYEGKINEISEILVEYSSQDYNFKGLKFDNAFRKRLITFLGDYFLNNKSNLYWPEENADMLISFVESENLKPPFKISPYYDEIQLKLKPKVRKMPFNAILMIDCSGSMKKEDVNYMSMDSAIDNLMKIYNGESILHKKLLTYFQDLKPKFIINEKEYKISRIQATFIAILMFFSQKISRGLGEKCSIILYSDKSKMFKFQGSKTIFDPNDFTDINVIDALNSELTEPKGLSQNQTLFSPAIKRLEKIIEKHSKEGPNPILTLFLTDGQPEPKERDPYAKIEKSLKYLMQKAKEIDKQISIFTLGIGRKIQVDSKLLERIAEIGKGEYHFTKNFEELTNWFENLANEFSIILRKI